MTDEEQSNPWAKVVGPCYTVVSMARILGWSEDDVVEAGEALRLLMLCTEEGTLLFPAFQLHEGKVVAGLTEVLRVLQTGVDDPWTWTQWLNVAVPGVVPPRNIQYLYEGRLTEAVRDAEHVAWAWSS
ncbi:hypothetical protein QYR02_01325 [Microbacterium maritypicum]|uniref:hypothetical protein n=1 Tax=Microbacterium maritypicum TaxID=33918 RepID=UPI002673A187|nr:hypothetical protein [Microbacterium liquefaciens]WKT89580.1 hypothetical protein QYR02_01325 [Microbacterium liquefaciens]